jgi:hypothetical protein
LTEIIGGSSQKWKSEFHFMERALRLPIVRWHTALVAKQCLLPGWRRHGVAIAASFDANTRVRPGTGEPDSIARRMASTSDSFAPSIHAAYTSNIVFTACPCASEPVSVRELIGWFGAGGQLLKMRERHGVPRRLGARD